jgi:hypothetical protein
LICSTLKLLDPDSSLLAIPFLLMARSSRSFDHARTCNT